MSASGIFLIMLLAFSVLVAVAAASVGITGAVIALVRGKGVADKAIGAASRLLPMTLIVLAVLALVTVPMAHRVQERAEAQMCQLDLGTNASQCPSIDW